MTTFLCVQDQNNQRAVLHSSFCEDMKEQIQMQCLDQIRVNPNCNNYLIRQKNRVDEFDAFQKSMEALEKMESRINSYRSMEDIRKYAQESIESLKTCRKYIKVPRVIKVDSGVFVRDTESSVSYIVHNVQTCEVREGVNSQPFFLDYGERLLDLPRDDYRNDSSFVPYNFSTLVNHLFAPIISRPKDYVETHYDQFLWHMFSSGLRQARTGNKGILFDEHLNRLMIGSQTIQGKEVREISTQGIAFVDSISEVLRFRDGNRVDISRYNISVEVDAISNYNIVLPPFFVC